MCEKPLAPTLSEAQRCINALGDQASKVLLAFNQRFDAGHAALKRAVEAGEIGNLEQLTITSRDPAPPPLDYIPKSGGLFRDMMTPKRVYLPTSISSRRRPVLFTKLETRRRERTEILASGLIATDCRK